MSLEEKKAVKRPTSQKRQIQSEKKRLINKSMRSEIRTLVRNLREAVAKGDKKLLESSLKDVYSLADKAVNKGVYKKNKASRIKSRVTAFIRKVA